ncbi:DNA-directed RNA polymerase subunit A' [Candidatus Woesearchaeota archaeon]|nr:DNA-directed RNA polymerase subunit A' [Candidatus Woesearchaeota archaeon]RLE43012.1 MAG: DNA-directed RNA polymerase subunit A' [Candidatus Woesearchaeota archaeon]
MFNPNIPVYKKIEKIVFKTLSPQLIKKMSSAKIVTPELYDKEGYPVDGGLMDVRLGVIDPGLRCGTCGSRLKECPGHFGHISLARPVIHVKFVRTIHNFLRGTCQECSRALIDDKKKKEYLRVLRKCRAEKPDLYWNKVAEIVSEMTKVSKCPHCNAKQKEISLEKPTTFVEKDTQTRISPIEIRSRFEKIPDEDCELFGLNPDALRPEWMILTILPIPPVTARPSITLESGERSEDDLTHKLGDIVRINQRLFENINAGAPEIIIEDLWDLLQYHVTTFFDNNISQVPPARHRSGQPLKTLSERIKSKEGRIRRNLAGKRTNYSARTVISPDPLLELYEVGVPYDMATVLTVPEVVTEWNIDYLKKFVERGPKEYPGANYIVRPDGKKKKITDETKEQALEELEPGYIVERHVMDGDIALFNRQPSLHRMSMMCHRVKVLKYKTLRLNPAVCHPYNADFDGDEMNLHIPQTEEARAEAELLMSVKYHLISPRYGLSIIGCVQDALAGNYLLTRKDTKMPYHEAVDLLFSAGVTDFSRLPKKPEVTGKEIFSALLPSDFDFIGESKAVDIGEKTREVIIKKGKLVKGILDSNNLGQGAGMMLRKLHEMYGEDATIKLLGNIFKLGIQFLMKRGFTIAISDMDLPKEAKQQIQATLKQAEEDVNKLIQSYHSKELRPLPGRTREDTLEIKILERLNQARDETGRIVAEYADPDSHTMIMAMSGARGKLLNLAQIAGSVGQQALRGKRISGGYSHRTLSNFPKDSLSPASKGFIKSSFSQGMRPDEFFFQAITGRDSLMDTALRTPKSGYLYRRLSNAMQDLKVEYDHTVRDVSKKIIQFRYGEDGIDVSKSEGGKLDISPVIDEVLGK